MRLAFCGAVSLLIFASCPASALPILPRYECVPVARSLSGIQIRGDAYTWWDQAEGHYRRGDAPKSGAVLAFKPHGAMRLGHVAAVSKVIDSRTILVTHSNWSPINGVRGQIERDVKVVDVSDAGDWSKVRVWFAPSQALGTGIWPVHGFIYPDGKAPMLLPRAGVGAKPAKVAVDVLPTGRLNYLATTLSKLQKR